MIKKAAFWLGVAASYALFVYLGYQAFNSGEYLAIICFVVVCCVLVLVFRDGGPPIV